MFQKNPKLMEAGEIGQFKNINKETASLVVGQYVDYLFEFANKHRSSQDLQHIADLYKFAAARGHGKAKECYRSLLPQLLALQKEDQRQLPSAANLIDVSKRTGSPVHMTAGGGSAASTILNPVVTSTSSKK